MGRFEFLHRLSKKLTDENRIICHEDLSVKNMTGNAKGTAEEPGKHVRAKTGLNREILDKGWYKFRQMLEYKAQWKGGITVPVDARHTSQQCSRCGRTAKENRRTQAKFKCVNAECGHEENADINAAKNILSKGLKELSPQVQRPIATKGDRAGIKTRVRAKKRSLRPGMREDAPNFKPSIRAKIPIFKAIYERGEWLPEIGGVCNPKERHCALTKGNGGLKFGGVLQRRQIQQRPQRREWWPEIWRYLQPSINSNKHRAGNGGLKFGGVCNPACRVKTERLGNGGLKFGGVCNRLAHEETAPRGNGGLKFGGVCNLGDSSKHCRYGNVA